jgi:hypothetical protein
MEVEIQKEKNVEKNKNKMEERKMRKQITFLCHVHMCAVQKPPKIFYGLGFKEVFIKIQINIKCNS